MDCVRILKKIQYREYPNSFLEAIRENFPNRFNEQDDPVEKQWDWGAYAATYVEYLSKWGNVCNWIVFTIPANLNNFEGGILLYESLAPDEIQVQRRTVLYICCWWD